MWVWVYFMSLTLTLRFWFIFVIFPKSAFLNIFRTTHFSNQFYPVFFFAIFLNFDVFCLFSSPSMDVGGEWTWASEVGPGGIVCGVYVTKKRVSIGNVLNVPFQWSEFALNSLFITNWHRCYLFLQSDFWARCITSLSSKSEAPHRTCICFCDKQREVRRRGYRCAGSLGHVIVWTIRAYWSCVLAKLNTNICSYFKYLVLHTFVSLPSNIEN